MTPSLAVMVLQCEEQLVSVGGGYWKAGGLRSQIKSPFSRSCERRDNSNKKPNPLPAELQKPLSQTHKYLIIICLQPI
jgi:hypothetical protein